MTCTIKKHKSNDEFIIYIISSNKQAAETTAGQARAAVPSQADKNDTSIAKIDTSLIYY
ncbi:hypothetical protein ACHAWT_008915 [Skeletonema menzelii]